MKTITYTRQAAKQLAKLPPHVRESLIEKLHSYADTGGSRTKALKGTEAVRLRAGDYRVVFGETETEITVIAAGHRREIYR